MGRTYSTLYTSLVDRPPRRLSEDSFDLQRPTGRTPDLFGLDARPLAEITESSLLVLPPIAAGGGDVGFARRRIVWPLVVHLFHTQPNARHRQRRDN